MSDDAEHGLGVVSGSVTSPIACSPADWHDPDATRLRRMQQREIAIRYGGAEMDAEESDVRQPVEVATIVATVLLRVDGEPVACGTLRDVSGAPDGVGGHHAPGTGEVKRVYVAPGYRGRGLSRAIMAELEERAVARGLDLLVLETGVRQPEAMGLYLALGFEPIDRYGEYAHEPGSRCFAKSLRRTSARPGADTGAGTVGEVAVREVPWGHPDAVALRRENSRTSTTVLYPGVAEHLERRGGFDAVDAEIGKTVLAAFVAYAAPDAGTPGLVVPVGFAALARVSGPVAAALDEADDRAGPGRGRGPDPDLGRTGSGDHAGTGPAPRTGSGPARRTGTGPAPRTGEVRKLFVRESTRRAGVARALMGAVEKAGRERGLGRLILETGYRQLPALRLYSSLGYRPIEPYPPYEDSEIALCFARSLP